MESGKISQTRAQSTSFYGRCRNRFARTSFTTRILLGLFGLAALMMGLHTALAPKNSSLHITVQHSFRSANISVWVDGNLAYSGTLSGLAKKKFGLIAGSLQGSLSESVPVTAGIHQVRVRVETDSGSTQQSSIDGEFAANSERKLSISARPGNVALAWQGVSTVAPSVPDSSSWLARYASTLALTIGGSIVSALTGFALRELPAHFQPRRQEQKEKIEVKDFEVKDLEVKVQSTAAGQ